MLHRRRFLAAGIAGISAMASHSGSVDGASLIPAVNAEPNEDLFAWIQRTHGSWDEHLYRQMLGAANDFKEGDQILGVAAADEATRRLARTLLSHTTIEQIDQHPPFKDDLFEFINKDLDASLSSRPGEMTLGELKNFSTRT